MDAAPKSWLHSNQSRVFDRVGQYCCIRLINYCELTEIPLMVSQVECDYKHIRRYFFKIIFRDGLTEIVYKPRTMDYEEFCGKRIELINEILKFEPTSPITIQEIKP